MSLLMFSNISGLKFKETFCMTNALMCFLHTQSMSIPLSDMWLLMEQGHAQNQHPRKFESFSKRQQSFYEQGSIFREVIMIKVAILKPEKMQYLHQENYSNMCAMRKNCLCFGSTSYQSSLIKKRQYKQISSLLRLSQLSQH